uniref:Putative secreted protein n=1 Tax=Ixodes ricinus TaxID=34613 RepID=A0A6B0UVG7_IXORI
MRLQLQFVATLFIADGLHNVTAQHQVHLFGDLQQLLDLGGVRLERVLGEFLPDLDLGGPYRVRVTLKYSADGPVQRLVRVQHQRSRGASGAHFARFLQRKLRRKVALWTPAAGQALATQQNVCFCTKLREELADCLCQSMLLTFHDTAGYVG